MCAFAFHCFHYFFLHKLINLHCVNVTIGGNVIIWSWYLSWGFGSSNPGFLLLYGKYHQKSIAFLVLPLIFLYVYFLYSWQRYCPLPLSYSSFANFHRNEYQRNTTLFVSRAGYVVARIPHKHEIADLRLTEAELWYLSCALRSTFDGSS